MKIRQLTEEIKSLLEDRDVDGILHLNTKEACYVFENEVTGQISDGAWENAKPDNHWIFWCHTKPVIDGKFGLECIKGYPVKRGYNLTSLMEYVDDRIIAYCIAAKANKDPRLTEYLLGWKSTLQNPNSDYWKKISEEVKAEFGDDLDKAFDEIKDLANEKDAIKALQEIHKAMITDVDNFKPRSSDMEKLKAYMDKGSKPEVLVNSIKNNVEKLENRYVASKQLGWTEFANEIEKRANEGTIPVTMERLQQIGV